jgi:hypothetical protein
MDAFQSALVRAAALPAPPAPVSPSLPLSRRVPGASLAPGLRDTAAPPPSRPAAMPRDPEAERAAFDGYAAGVAQAGHQTQSPPTRTKESSP